MNRLLKFAPILLLSVGLQAGCARLGEVGKAPEFSSSEMGNEYHAMVTPPLPLRLEDPDQPFSASLWSGNRKSLLGDRRAVTRGDILTVVVEIDEKAEFSNSSERSRKGKEDLSMPDLIGIPQRLQGSLPDGASFDPAVSVNSKSESEGDGSIKRREKVTLRVAATVLGVLPNGVMQI